MNRRSMTRCHVSLDQTPYDERGVIYTFGPHRRAHLPSAALPMPPRAANTCFLDSHRSRREIDQRLDMFPGFLQGITRCRVNIVEYFEKRKREITEQLEAIESGRIIRIVYETKDGPIDVTDNEKQRLRQASQDYCAQNLRRINSSQMLHG
jgi:hypothetical protein